MAFRGRAAVRLDNILVDGDSGSDSDAETYDEALEVASAPGTIFEGQTDDDATVDDISGPATARTEAELPREVVVETPKLRRSKRQKRDQPVAPATPERLRPDDVYTFPSALAATPKQHNLRKETGGGSDIDNGSRGKGPPAITGEGGPPIAAERTGRGSEGRGSDIDNGSRGKGLPAITREGGPPIAVERTGGDSDIDNGSRGKRGEGDEGAKATEGDPKKPRGRSIAWEAFERGKAVLVSFDMETAGEHVGVVQISAEILRVGLEPTGKSFTKDRKGTVLRGVTFNEYVNPKSDLDWDLKCIRSHHLLPTDPKIKDADEIDVVWGRFATWIEQNIAKDETGILIAWNGTSCDLKWIWKLTQAPLSTLSMPVQIEFYIDPYRAIMQHDKNPLHPSQSKVESMELGVIWKFINGGPT